MRNPKKMEKGKKTNKKKKEEVIELTSGESSGESSSSESSSSSTSRDSASQPGSDSEESSSSDKRSRFRWEEVCHGCGPGRIIGASYPSSSTGGAQRAASSGGGNNQDDSRCRYRSGGNSSRGKHSRSRAYTFRKSNEYRRIIHMVDVDGNLSRVKARGQMNITNHRAVLQAVLLHSR